jgi:hypothetical protein
MSDDKTIADAILQSYKTIEIIHYALLTEKQKPEKDQAKIKLLEEAYAKSIVANELLQGKPKNSTRPGGSKTKKGGNKKRRKTRNKKQRK